MPTIIPGTGSPDFDVPLPVSEGGTGASTSIGSGGVMLSGQTGSAPVFGARAWCVFDGTLTGTNAPLAGGNVTSVTRNGAGDYTVNFTTAMPDTNYSVSVTPDNKTNNCVLARTQDGTTARTTTAVRVVTLVLAGTNADCPITQIVVYR